MILHQKVNIWVYEVAEEEPPKNQMTSKSN